jgi:atypical dual specificity phosphatase
MIYKTSLAYTKLVTDLGFREKYDKIGDLPLYLGMIPMKEDMEFLIKDLKITHVVSILESHEYEESMISEPITPLLWYTNNINTSNISSPDYLPLSQNAIKNGVELLEKILDKGQTVYIHCKAGVGRSATIVVAYIMKKHNIPLDCAIEYVKKYRNINIGYGQKKALKEYEVEIKNN